MGVSELCCKKSVKNRKYTVVYNSYDEQKYNLNVKNKLSDDELVITQVASYSENKNQLFSLQVLKELKKLYENARINMVGASEMNLYYQRLVNYMKDDKLENNVSCIERSDSVEKIYEKTSCVIIPSKREGFPSVAVEAQACDISVFASSTIPKEIDCGGVVFIDLHNTVCYWAECIYKNHKEQLGYFNVQRFSKNIYKNTLLKVYQ